MDFMVSTKGARSSRILQKPKETPPSTTPRAVPSKNPLTMRRTENAQDSQNVLSHTSVFNLCKTATGDTRSISCPDGYTGCLPDKQPKCHCPEPDLPFFIFRYNRNHLPALRLLPPVGSGFSAPPDNRKAAPSYPRHPYIQCYIPAGLFLQFLQ